MEKILYIYISPKELTWADLGMRRALYLKEGVGPLGGEVWLILASQDLVEQQELHLGVVDCLTTNG